MVRLRIEFTLFFLIFPVVGAVALPPNMMFGLLFSMTLVGLVLLQLTPGFRWAELVQGLSRLGLGPICLFAVAMLLASVLIVHLTVPHALFFLPRQNPQIMLMIALLYPILSALPQELVYRALFFRRYHGLLPAGSAALALNAGLFALAHLMYWSWLVLAMTFVGGLIFAHAYVGKQSFPLAFVLHALAGIILFAAGLGVYFYSGNVVRPF